ncbi:MAG: hypothetical protein HY231_03555 [Acidobacteria bacterium]|nr:hypothetical protein [Acidobacteriota bacterium]
MTATTYCSKCGEKITTAASLLSGLVVVCPRCQKTSLTKFAALIALLTLGLLAGFFIGRLTRPRPSFQFIGSTVDLQSARQSASNEPHEATANHETPNRPPQSDSLAPPTIAAEAALTVCGAPTKSGRPCRRKVRGGGYCYQHKDKVNATTSSAPPPPSEAVRASP